MNRSQKDSPEGSYKGKKQWQKTYDEIEVWSIPISREGSSHLLAKRSQQSMSNLKDEEFSSG
jgi:hypothetical protein